MPLHNFKCTDCGMFQEHFLLSNSKKQMKCPGCSSERYIKQLSRFQMDVEPSDFDDLMDRKVQPLVDESYERIGREAMSEDTKTLDDLYGEDKVKKTFYQEDET